jgi:hypothetical protein
MLELRPQSQSARAELGVVESLLPPLEARVSPLELENLGLRAELQAHQVRPCVLSLER